MKLYDTIHNIEDFKKKIETRHNLKDLRISVEEEALEEITMKVSVILTIPHKDTILRHFVGKKLFNRYFYYDKNFDENKKYRDFIKECCDKAKKHFGEITDGYWSTD